MTDLVEAGKLYVDAAADAAGADYDGNADQALRVADDNLDRAVDALVASFQGAKPVYDPTEAHEVLDAAADGQAREAAAATDVSPPRAENAMPRAAAELKAALVVAHPTR